MENSLTTPPTQLFEYWFPEKKFITFPEAKNDKLNTHFREKFGYDIPEIVIKETIGNKSMYKAVPKSYLTNHDPLATVETEDILNAQLSKKIADIQTKEELKKTITSKELIVKKALAENAQLKAQILEHETQIAKIEKKIALQKKHLQTTPANQPCLPKVIKGTSAPMKNMEKQAAGKKKNALISQTTKPTMQKPALPKQNPNKNHLQQRMYVIRCLIKNNNVQTAAQLKNKFNDECYNEDCDILFGRINRYCTWEYDPINNELTIDTDDCESDDSCSDSSTDSV